MKVLTFRLLFGVNEKFAHSAYFGTADIVSQQPGYN